MPNLKSWKAGGAATAKKLRKEALARYYKDPQVCAQCGKIIRIKDKQKVGEVRVKKFCGRSCAVTYNNGKKAKRKRKPRFCIVCSTNIEYQMPLGSSRKYCKECSEKQILKRSEVFQKRVKGELFAEYKNWQSARSSIQQHARKTLRKINPDFKCTVCGYDVHAEVCHIKDVSSFEDTALISEINNPENLVALCPNHHYEFDNGILRLDK